MLQLTLTDSSRVCRWHIYKRIVQWHILPWSVHTSGWLPRTDGPWRQDHEWTTLWFQKMICNGSTAEPDVDGICAKGNNNSNFNRHCSLSQNSYFLNVTVTSNWSHCYKQLGSLLQPTGVTVMTKWGHCFEDHPTKVGLRLPEWLVCSVCVCVCVCVCVWICMFAVCVSMCVVCVCTGSWAGTVQICKFQQKQL